MLQGKVKIFRITNKHVFPEYISFSLHNKERIICHNKPPFTSYQIGEHLGIELDVLDKCPIEGDTNTVARVLYRPPQFYQKKIIKDPEFGDGWVEE